MLHPLVRASVVRRLPPRSAAGGSIVSVSANHLQAEDRFLVERVEPATVVCARLLRLAPELESHNWRRQADLGYHLDAGRYPLHKNNKSAKLSPALSRKCHKIELQFEIRQRIPHGRTRDRKIRDALRQSWAGELMHPLNQAGPETLVTRSRTSDEPQCQSLRRFGNLARLRYGRFRPKWASPVAR
jgi:hypothetical protein